MAGKGGCVVSLHVCLRAAQLKLPRDEPRPSHDSPASTGGLAKRNATSSAAASPHAAALSAAACPLSIHPPPTACARRTTV